jgi:recombination protein RecT
MPSRTQSRTQNPQAAPPNEERGVVPFDAKVRAREIEATLDARRGQFLALLGGDPKLTDRFLTVVLDAVVRSRDLLEADPLSLLTSVRTAATLGLEPTGVLGDGAIIARRDRNQGGKKIATFQPMYRGLMRLARSSGQVASMDAAIVYENDEFDITRGTEPRILHRPTLDDDMGGVKGAYAFAKLTSGELIVRYWPTSKLIRHRDRFAKDSAFWKNHPEPMMMKTVVHDLMKYLPLGHTASMAVAVDEAVEFGEPTPPAVLSRTARRLGAGQDLDDDGEKAPESPENGSGQAEPPEAAPTAMHVDKGAQEPNTEGTAREICGKPGPDRDSQLCVAARGHAGTHADGRGATWL